MEILRNLVRETIEQYKTNDFISALNSTDSATADLAEIGGDFVQYGRGTIAINATMDGMLRIIITPRTTRPVSADLDALQSAINPLFTTSVEFTKDGSSYVHTEPIEETAFY